MTDISRRYYERELGAGLGPSPSLKEHFGYSEPLRRFIQRASFEPQANEIPNTMPSWLPGDDYMTNFKVGDPYIGIDDGYARLPGAGYEALHPELKGLNPEDYPDIHKLRILGDVAPYSRSTPGVSLLPDTKTFAHARQAQAPFMIRLSPRAQHRASCRLARSTQRKQARACSLTEHLHPGASSEFRVEQRVLSGGMVWLLPMMLFYLWVVNRICFSSGRGRV
jgi:hypothetical protein